MQNTDFRAVLAQQQTDAVYKKVFDLKYNNTSAILQTISEVDRLLQQYPNNTELLVLQTRLQIMNSQEQRARAIAAHTWEVGGNLRPKYEKMYVSDLINLAMVDMAQILLSPRLNNVEQGMNFFPLEMIRFALMTGNLEVLSRIVQTNRDNQMIKALAQFVYTYERTDYARHFANIQKIALENVKQEICGYDFNCYVSRGFTDVEIIMYFSNYNFELQKYKESIERDINEYCTSAGIKRIYNLSFSCQNIKDCPAI